MIKYYLTLAWIAMTAALSAQVTNAPAPGLPAATVDAAASTNAVNLPRARFGQSPANSIASATNSPAAASRTPADLPKLIASRNIFDPTRTPRTAGQPRVRTQSAPAARVELFGLVGTMISSKGGTAFFSGSGGPYQKALKQGESIAGYKVEQITPKSVTLVGTNTPVEMKIGNYLRRENEGSWALSAAPEPPPLASSSESSDSSSSTATTSSSSSSAGSAEVSDIVRKLMEKRRQAQEQ